MKILDRYILKELSTYSLLALAVFSFILALPEVVRLSELFARQNLSSGTLFRLGLTVVPGKLVWTIPMAVLVGLLVGWSRLAVDGEVIAWQAAAVGFGRLLQPALLFVSAAFLLALLASVWWAPQAARQFRRLQAEVGAGEVAYEIQARVFDERFPNWILYVQDVESGGARWKGVFLADVSRPAATKLTLAESGIVVNEPGRRRLQLHLLNGSVHEHSPQQPERYSVSTFAESDLNLPWPEIRLEPMELRRHAELGLAELWRASQEGNWDWRATRVDFHRRLALPAACLVFALVAVPLGIAGGRSGRAAGLVLAFFLMAGYYVVFVFTDRLAREGGLPPALGVWAANLSLAVVGTWLLLRARRPARGISLWRLLQDFAARRWRPLPAPNAANSAPARRPPRARLPRLLDLYVARSVLFHFALWLGSFLVLFELFNLLDLVDEIAQNQVPWSVVAWYLWYLLPQALYWMAPLAGLLAVLVALGVFSKRNELVAIKAAGISLFRIAAPVVVLGLLLSLALFALDLSYLPHTNQRQEALRNLIKGRPPQTVYQPQRKWIFGRGARIFHYRFFDSRENLLGEVSVFQLAPDGFALRQRLFAHRAHWAPTLAAWVFEDGWRRDFSPERSTAFEAFKAAAFPALNESPAYFRKEVLESAQMNYRQLGQYLTDLKQAGFAVSRLEVEWHRKFAFPLAAPVMMLLAFPFGLRVGRRGALGGIAVGIGLGLSYWVVSTLFEALGKFQLLPPFLAAWGPLLLFAFAGLYWMLHVRT